MSNIDNIFSLIPVAEYSSLFSGTPVTYDITRFNETHSTLDQTMRKYWMYFHPLVKDLLFSFSQEFNKLVNVVNIADAEVSHLNQKLFEYENSINILEGGADELNANHLIMKQEINNILDINERLKWKIKATELEHKEVNQKLTKALKENFELRKQLGEQNSSTQFTENFEQNEIIQENKILNNELVKLYEEKESLERVNQELKTQIKELNDQILSQNEGRGIMSSPPEQQIDISDISNPAISRVHELESENAHLNEKIVEVLNVNNRTATLINILIEMRKQMLVLQNEVKKKS